VVRVKGHLDLFSGIGGFSLGLKQAGIEPEWLGFSDINGFSNKVFKRRFPDGHELGSITDISYESLRGQDIDLLTGGFPCQTFSVAGKRRGFEDTRGTLFFEIARICKEYIDRGRPISHILCENVKGMVNHDGGRTLAVILGTLRELGYTLEYQVVNTRWYRPQNRERIYIFGRYNGNPGGRKIFPLKTTIREDNGTSKIAMADYRTDEGLRIRESGVSPTLTLATPPMVIEDRIRRITPIEAARLQGFPDDWNDCQSDGQRYKQYGNAITVDIAEIIYRRIYKREEKRYG